MRMRYRESGNVLFLVLIAVALFAALSYAVTQSTRSGSGSIDADKLKLEAASLLSWAAEAQTSFKRRQIAYNISDTGWGFAAPGGGNSGDCSYSQPNPVCQFFIRLTGGYSNPEGMRFARIPVREDLWVLSISNVNFNANTEPQMGGVVINVKGLGSDTNGEIALQVFGLTRQFCEAINDALQIEQPPSFPQASSEAASYDSPLPDTSSLYQIGTNEPSLVGQTIFCNNKTNFFGGSVYQLYIVLDEN